MKREGKPSVPLEISSLKYRFRKYEETSLVIVVLTADVRVPYSDWLQAIAVMTTIDGLVQDCSIFIAYAAYALGILQFCTMISK